MGYAWVWLWVWVWVGCVAVPLTLIGKVLCERAELEPGGNLSNKARKKQVKGVSQQADTNPLVSGHRTQLTNECKRGHIKMRVGASEAGAARGHAAYGGGGRGVKGLRAGSKVGSPHLSHVGAPLRVRRNLTPDLVGPADVGLAECDQPALRVKRLCFKDGGN